MSFSSTALSQYFAQSDQFYYFIADIRGKLIYLNPFLQKTIHIPGHHDPLSIADIFVDAQNEYDDIVIKCLGSETSIEKAEFRLRSAENNDSCINWEISIFENEDGVRNTQGIGIAINRQNDHPEPHSEL